GRADPAGGRRAAPRSPRPSPARPGPAPAAATARPAPAARSARPSREPAPGSAPADAARPAGEDAAEAEVAVEADREDGDLGASGQLAQLAPGGLADRVHAVGDEHDRLALRGTGSDALDGLPRRVVEGGRPRRLQHVEHARE